MPLDKNKKLPSWDSGYVTPFKDLTPHQKLILLIRDSIEKWETWLQENRAFLGTFEVECHEQSMRYAKFIVKAWRIAAVRHIETARQQS